jgi:hypothetical protein
LSLSASLIIELQKFSTWALFGLIWTVQLVHYPGFHFVKETEALRFHEFHSSRITIVVLPLMVLELACAVLLLKQRFGTQDLWCWINLGTVLAVWVATFSVSVPIHNKLGVDASSWTTAVIKTLVDTNWIRTVLWTVRAALVFKGLDLK